MEFHVELAGLPVDPDALRAVLLDVDPAAVVDLDRTGSLLRVSVQATAAGLVELMQRAGYPLAPAQVLEVPSFCCGGCGG